MTIFLVTLPAVVNYFFKEIGRAGRDGEQSEAHLIFSKKGIGKMAYFARLEKDFERAQLMRSNAKKMETYINTQQCRRLPLLRHFDPDATSSVTATPKCCDNCEGGNTTAFYEVKEEANFGSDAAIVFECLAEFSSKPSRTMLQLHIRGSKAKQLKPEMHSKLNWGKGKFRNFFKPCGENDQKVFVLNFDKNGSSVAKLRVKISPFFYF